MHFPFSRCLTPHWLTEVLRRHGHLAHGSVVDVQIVQALETPPSYHAHLVTTYSPDAAPAPTHLIAKIPKDHTLARGQREARFYASVAPLMPTIALVPCYGSGTLPSTAIPYVLLTDVSATHRTVAREDLTWAQIEAMIALLAQVHAAWWQHPHLDRVVGEMAHTWFAADFAGNDQRYAEVVGLLGEQLTRTQRRAFEQYLATAPMLLLSRAQHGALTLCHPDNHPANFLFPQHSDAPLYLIDWHSYHSWWGPSDVVILLNRCLGHDQLARRDDLLRFYHYQLLAHGVREYSWDQCWQDYRLGVIAYFGVLLGYRRWQEWFVQHLSTLMCEFDALACAKLLTEALGNNQS